MNRNGWRLVPYAVLAVALLTGSVALSVWTERTKYVDCRGAGHSLAVCVARSIL
jgi:hypothetical protein